MIGCHIGRFFQVTVSGGSYQEGLSATLQGMPAGLPLTEQEIYADLLLRKPGADELSSPRKEPDLPVIYAHLQRALYVHHRRRGLRGKENSAQMRHRRFRLRKGSGGRALPGHPARTGAETHKLLQTNALRL